MKITSVESFVHPDFPNIIYVKIGTDAGVYGIGESYYFGRTVATFVDEFVAPTLIGLDPANIENISRKLTTYVGALSSGVEMRAKSAVDIALWDIKGKVEGKPIYQLLGGQSKALSIYNTCAGRGYMRKSDQDSSAWGISDKNDQYEDLQAFLTDAGSLAKELLAEGIGGMKIWPFDTYAEKNDGKDISDEDLKKGLIPLQKVRDAVGEKMQLMLELHALWSPLAAKKIFEATKDLKLTWIEDPIYPDLLDDYALLRSKGYAPIAHGETVTSMVRVEALLKNDYIDVLTLDLGWCGGFTQGIKFTQATKKYGKSIAPHDCSGPIGLIAGAHLSTAYENALVQETSRASLRTWYPMIVTTLPTIADGKISLSQEAGLGTDLTSTFTSAAKFAKQA
ncbi:mandelate racemase [Candidatus Nanopelagicus hibericus]|uniref:Mandelate racemase n=1 Tax=Candidatus Nanopelagicus hibericus TaxID=1884915 RepID=A0A249K8T2_9ACTN|nr:mandelate racemase/muconate lactonizing enzyme family protein [Candidatus Nanopelagicus hibericus]ASY13146.1 mandelate racemase [Candidatus Nanopelagicus hibericus]